MARYLTIRPLKLSSLKRLPLKFWSQYCQSRTPPPAARHPGRGVLAVAVSLGLGSAAIAAAVVGLRNQGWLQPLELLAYDRMVQIAPVRGADPRLLVVEITEQDIQNQRSWPLPDQVLAQALAQLQRHQPRVIGLDLWRDFPQKSGNQSFTQQLRAPNLIAIRKLGDQEDRGVEPPPGINPSQVGFNDLPIDPDGVARRMLLFAEQGEESYTSFGALLAFHYLAPLGITPQNDPNGSDQIHLGQARLHPLDSHAGGYHNGDAAGFQLLTDLGNRPVAQRVSLTQVLRGQVQPQWVKNKVVLIGATARSAKDSFPSPYSATSQEGALTPGVMLHAHATASLIQAALGQTPPLSFWSEEQELLWIFTWSLVSGAIAWGLRSTLASGLANLALGGLLLAGSYHLFLLRTWVPVVTPLLSQGLTAALVTTVRAQQAQRRQQITMRLLGQNTSPEVAQALWESRDRLLKSGVLPGQGLTATLLFTDIKDFSTASESMRPEDLLEWLNEYLSVLAEAVTHRRGVVNKFTGDGIFAVFGVPIPRESPEEIAQDALAAVEAALEMGDRLAMLNPEWRDRGLPVVQMRAGIYTGAAVVGSLGSKDRLEYGVLGDSVNTASRLESCEKHRHDADELCRILIGKETLEYLGDRFVVESWGPLALKGKQQTVEVYRVLGWAHPPTPAAPPGSQSPRPPSKA